MNTLITTLIAGLAWWPQGRHDAANTGRIYGHGKIVLPNIACIPLDPYNKISIESRYGATVGDVDGDGKNEIIVVAGNYTGWVGIYGLEYDGSVLSIEKHYQVGPYPNQYQRIDCAPALVEVGKMLGEPDGIPDIIWHWGSADGRTVEAADYYAWSSGNPPPFFWRQPAFTIDPSSPAVADLNGDQCSDAVLGTWKPQKGVGQIIALDGQNGESLWKWDLPSEHPNSYSKPAVGDVDGDGNPEVVFTAGTGAKEPGGYEQIRFVDYLGVLGNTGSLSPVLLASWTQENTWIGWCSAPVLVNLDLDPNLEIVLFCWEYAESSNSKVIALDYANGSLSPLWSSACPNSSSPPYASPAVADMNGDGEPDVVVASMDGYVCCFSRDGALLWSVQPPYAEAFEASPAIADLDGDPSDLEVVVASSNGWVYILHGANGGVFWSHQLSSDEYITASPTIADCDGDGWLEIVVCGYSGRVYVIDGSPLFAEEPAWAMVPNTSLVPSPDPSWKARFYDASVMPPDRAIDRDFGIDPNLVSDTMVAVGEFGFTTWPIPPFSYYSHDGGMSWFFSSLIDPYPIDGLRYFADEYHLYGVHLTKYAPGLSPRINGVAVGWAVVKELPQPPYIGYGCILITTDGGKTWQDETGDLLGVSNYLHLPEAPLTDAVIVTDGHDHKTWIVGLSGQVYTGSLTNNGLKQVNPPPQCPGGKAPLPDLYGVHAYYPYPGSVQNFIWVAGKCWDRGYIDWGYYNESNGQMAWGTPPCCHETTEAFYDAIYDQWAQGAQIPSLPGYCGSFNEAGITDSVFAVGMSKKITPVRPYALIWGTTDRMKSYELEDYQANRSFYDISTLEYPALRRYVFGEGPIRYWDYNFTKEDWLLPDEYEDPDVDRIAIKNDNDPNPPGRILYGCADNYPLAVGEMNNLPCIWIKKYIPPEEAKR